MSEEKPADQAERIWPTTGSQQVHTPHVVPQASAPRERLYVLCDGCVGSAERRDDLIKAYRRLALQAGLLLPAAVPIQAAEEFFERLRLVRQDVEPDAEQALTHLLSRSIDYLLDFKPYLLRTDAAGADRCEKLIVEMEMIRGLFYQSPFGGESLAAIRLPRDVDDKERERRRREFERGQRVTAAYARWEVTPKQVPWTWIEAAASCGHKEGHLWKTGEMADRSVASERIERVLAAPSPPERPLEG